MISFFFSLYHRVSRLPIVTYYVYLFGVDRSLLLSTIFVNYFLPIFLELAPWFLSRRELSKILRDSRNALQHRVVSNQTFPMASVGIFLFLSLVYSAIQSLEALWRTRVMLQNRLVVKRLIVEKILYSEIGSLESSYRKMLGSEGREENLVAAEDFELRVFTDINDTLQLFNSTIPSIVRGLYTLGRCVADLWLIRTRLDPLALLRPSLVGFVGELSNLLRERFILDAQSVELQRNQSSMSRVVSSIVSGLSEIQVANGQEFQLSRLDALSRAELAAKQGFFTLANSFYRGVSNRGVFDFASEIFLMQKILNSRGLDHETFRQTQNDVEYATRLAGRIYALGRDALRVFESQDRVICLLNLPNFLSEATEIPGRFEFLTMKIRRLQFRYDENLPLALDIREDEEILLERGRVYGLLGQNRSGKSTLVQILCKLFKPQDSEIFINDRPFEQIPRVLLRRSLAYVPQRPFIFQGSIEENIRFGNTKASRAEVLQAAEEAGVFQQEKPAGLRRSAAPSKSEAAPRKPWERSRIRDSLSSAFSSALSFWSKIHRGERRICRPQEIARPPNIEKTSSAENGSLTDSNRLALLGLECAVGGSNLSGGFAQSVALARALLRRDAEFLILDEALSAMDSIKKRTIFPRLIEIARARRLTLVIISHDLPLIVERCDQIFCLEQGRCKNRGAPQELLRIGAQPYCKLLNQ